MTGSGQHLFQQISCGQQQRSELCSSKEPTEQIKLGMEDEKKTKAQLVAEIQELRRQVVDLGGAEKLSQNLLETANTLIVTLDDEATVTLFNSYAEKLTGYTKTEVLGRNWVDIFIPPEAKETIPEVIKKALQSRPEVSQFENRIILKNGEERIISWRNNVVRNSEGQANGILSVGVDITGHRQVERSLLKSRKRMQSYLSAIDNIGLGLLVVDGNYCVRDMNKTMIEWFGDQRGTVCHRSVAGLNKPCSYCRLTSVIEKRDTARHQVHSSGGRIFEIVTTAIDNQDGRVSMMAIIRDITKEEQALEKIKKLSSALESRVQERTLELEQKNKQLQHNKLEIEKKNITLRVLLDQQLATREELEGHMASRLKKLVYPYLELLEEEAAGSQAKAYIRIIAAHLDTMTSSFVKKLSNPLWQLTPREILVADLVQHGKCTREIGELLNISPRTAERYRNTIRKKIGLTQRKVSLYKYLNSVLSSP